VRIALTAFLVLALAVPAYAAGPTATTSSPQPAPGSPFAQPVQDLVGQPAETETVTSTKREGETDNGRGTLLFLSFAAILMLVAVGAFIWYEGTKRRATETKRRRQRMRAGRPAASAATLSAGARRGPPPPPRKRRSQSKRKKR